MLPLYMLYICNLRLLKYRLTELRLSKIRLTQFRLPMLPKVNMRLSSNLIKVKWGSIGNLGNLRLDKLRFYPH